ncbi:CRISPR-associated endonuclease Cas2 [Agarivorans sp. QJM3NY_33]|uniref:CRISPR-associated endonuclease Cas2 n=1 Tax=Agarivorans sp. QJM3NY_33 TaxID=3421432 RepID=UPI003D7E6DD2
MKLTYLVCFDIEDNRTRRRLGNELLVYGQRVQRSVFEVAFSGEVQLKQLKTQLQKILADSEGEEDDLRFYYINATTLARSATITGQAVGVFPSATVL